METRYFLGVDMAKNSFQAALSTDGENIYELQVPNRAVAIRAYFNDLKEKFALLPAQLIVCLEHTGMYTYPLLDYLVKTKIQVCLEPALHIQRSQGMRRGKSDKIDARRIVQYAIKNHKDLRFWRPQRRIIQQVKALLVTRNRLVKAKTQLEVPLTEAREYLDKSLRERMAKSCAATLKSIAKDIANLEVQIEALVCQDQPLQDQLKWVSSVPGVGKITALNVIVSSGEFQRISEAKKFACFAGVAPFEHTSGTSIRGKTRVSKMADTNIKKLLHLSAMCAIRYNDDLRMFYHRKVAEGKNKMSVLNAVRNKLISRIFACVKNQRSYEKYYQNALA